jgi:modulator of FtsH protease
MATDPTVWVDLAAAILVAAVSFAGLLFVALSINLEAILSFGGLADLGLIGVVILGNVAISAILLLIPGQSVQLLGIELAVLGVAFLVTTSMLSQHSYQQTDPQYRGNRIRATGFNTLPGLFITIAALSLLVGFPGGLYWLVPGWIAGIVAGIITAWVLLVEVKR